MMNIPIIHFKVFDSTVKNVRYIFPRMEGDNIIRLKTDISKQERITIKVDYTKMAKKYRYWKVKIKEVNNPSVITTGMYGPYELEDVRAHFGLDAPDVEWYTIEEEKGGKE